MLVFVTCLNPKFHNTKCKVVIIFDFWKMQSNIKTICGLYDMRISQVFRFQNLANIRPGEQQIPAIAKKTELTACFNFPGLSITGEN